MRLSAGATLESKRAVAGVLAGLEAVAAFSGTRRCLARPLSSRKSTTPGRNRTDSDSQTCNTPSPGKASKNLLALALDADSEAAPVSSRQNREP